MQRAFQNAVSGRRSFILVNAICQLSLSLFLHRHLKEFSQEARRKPCIYSHTLYLFISIYIYLYLFISTDCEFKKSSMDVVQPSNAGDLVSTHQDTQVTGPQVQAIALKIPWDALLIDQLWKVGF